MGIWEQHIEAENWNEPALMKVDEYVPYPEDIVDYDAKCPICEEYVYKDEKHIHFPGKNGFWDVYHVDCLLDEPKTLFGLFGVPIEEG